VRLRPACRCVTPCQEWRELSVDQLLRHIDPQLCRRGRTRRRSLRAARHRAGFEQDMRYNRKWLLTKSAGFRVAPIPRVSTEAAGAAQCPAVLRRHIVLVNLLSEGQHARVLQLPATRLAKKVGARAELAPVYSRRCSRLRAQRRLDIIFATVSRS
jgi:hypothetical protein